MANNFYQTLKKKLTLRWQSESHQTKLKNRIIQSTVPKAFDPVS